MRTSITSDRRLCQLVNASRAQGRGLHAKRVDRIRAITAAEASASRGLTRRKRLALWQQVLTAPEQSAEDRRRTDKRVLSTFGRLQPERRSRAPIAASFRRMENKQSYRQTARALTASPK